jgi:hypothetical protein
MLSFTNIGSPASTGSGSPAATLRSMRAEASSASRLVDVDQRGELGMTVRACEQCADVVLRAERAERIAATTSVAVRES